MELYYNIVTVESNDELWPGTVFKLLGLYVAIP